MLPLCEAVRLCAPILICLVTLWLSNWVCSRSYFFFDHHCDSVCHYVFLARLLSFPEHLVSSSTDSLNRAYHIRHKTDEWSKIDVWTSHFVIRWSSLVKTANVITYHILLSHIRYYPLLLHVLCKCGYVAVLVIYWSTTRGLVHW